MEKQKLRNEVEDKYKWDLQKIYSDDKECYKGFEVVKDLVTKIKEYENIEIDSGEKLYNLLKLNFELQKISERLSLYSSLQLAEDSTNSNNQKLYGEVTNFLTEIGSQLSFLTNKLLKIEYKKIEEFYKEYEKLIEYRFYLEVLFKDKEHILNDSEEKILSNLSKSLMLAEDAYDNLTNADMKFGNIIDENNNEVELNESNFSVYFQSKDRRVRKDAFKRYYSVYGSYKTTIASLYNSHLETNNIISKLRKYTSMLEEVLSYDNLPTTVYTNLINVVNSNLDKLHKYYKIKKDMLKLDEFHIYDNGAQVVNDINKKYSFEDGKELILDIFKIYGDDYTEILQKAFEQKWIDVYNNVGKRSGAFSAGVYDTYPYVLLNYENRIDDVSTMAHELGHSVNSYYSIKNNPIQYYDYPLFQAEVASLTNEIIFNKKMLEKENDPKIKLYILNNLIKLFNSNLFDATLYAEFEKDAHNMIENGEVITSDYLCNLCYNLNKKYYGNDVVVDEEIKYRWEIYSHLYTDFYLFKYATGISCACYCADKILSGDKEFINNYKEFLKVGCSKYPIDALKIVGIDITNSKFIENTIDFYDNLLDEFKNIYDNIN